MKYISKTSNLFKRYDTTKHHQRSYAPRIEHENNIEKIISIVVNGEDEKIHAAIQEAFKFMSPLEVTQKCLIAGMREVARLWEEGIYFLPQVILSSDTMIEGIKQCEQELGTSLERKAKIITHTAEGDIHDIGQSIVNALLNAGGFEVINLGADVPVDQVVNACIEHRPIMLTGTALMTTTMSAFPHISEKLLANNIIIPFVCGGGAVNEEFVNSFDLGIWGKEANQAVPIAEDALSGMGWHEMRAKWNG